MPSNSTGWLWHSLARETGRIGHLFSPDGQRGPWPWFPYALDNGAFSCWNMEKNIFDFKKWEAKEMLWRQLIFWATTHEQRPMWAIVPDVVGDSKATIARWPLYAPIIKSSGIPLAVAVQDGMTPEMVRALDPLPEVVCVGGTFDWKWATAFDWLKEFPRVHVLRVNSPEKLYELEAAGCESCDGTGWNRGNVAQTRGVEEWARQKAVPTNKWLWPMACKQPRDKKQMTFA